MAKKKKKALTKKQLAERLKKARVVEQEQLENLKKSKDVKFRKEIEKSTTLVPITDLNSEVRKKSRKSKSSKGNISAQRNRLRALEKENKKIVAKAKALKDEYPFVDDERKKEIKKLLEKPDYKKKDLFNDKNLLKYLEGKDFDFVIDDGFKKYRINTKEFKKKWKKGEDISAIILRGTKKDLDKSLKHYNKLIEKEKNTASKARLKSLRRIRDGLKNKLKHTVDKNIEAIESGNLKALDEYNDQGEKAYSLLFRVIGFSIDRVGI